MVIETKQLTKRYGRARGINQVNIQVEAGDVYGFIGPNGAGKSTTIRSLLGLINITSGEAYVLGMDVKKKRQEILSRVGYLPSESAFYPGMTIKEALQMSAKLRRKDCRRSSLRLLDRFEVDENRRIADLSFGNRRKVSIICALQHDPELVILDEPSTGLDPLMQKSLWDVLKERNQQGITVFVSSHALGEVQAYCKNAAIIREGEIIVQDSVYNLGNKAARRVTLRNITGEIPVLPVGVVEQKRTVKDFSFLYEGNVEDLKRFLTQTTFEDFTVTEPSMEEVFLHYYSNKGGAQ